MTYWRKHMPAKDPQNLLIYLFWARNVFKIVAKLICWKAIPIESDKDKVSSSTFGPFVFYLSICRQKTTLFVWQKVLSAGKDNLLRHQLICKHGNTSFRLLFGKKIFQTFISWNKLEILGLSVQTGGYFKVSQKC